MFFIFSFWNLLFFLICILFTLARGFVKGFLICRPEPTIVFFGVQISNPSRARFSDKGIKSLQRARIVFESYHFNSTLVGSKMSKRRLFVMAAHCFNFLFGGIFDLSCRDGCCESPVEVRRYVKRSAEQDRYGRLWAEMELTKQLKLKDLNSKS